MKGFGSFASGHILTPLCTRPAFPRHPTDPPNLMSFAGIRLVASLAACLAVAACGGGSSSPAPPGPPAPIQPGCSLLYPVDGGLPKPGVIDPRLSEQWHLPPASASGEGLGATTVWAEGITGAGVRVAVLDGPIESSHEDLAANVAAGAVYDYRLGTPTAPLPCTDDDWHGTAVAGVIAASGSNGLGGAGVAPSAMLALYNPISTGDSAHIADALTRDLALNHIYHSSWGSRDDGQLHAIARDVELAITSGLSRGRSGRGALYVFASGNGGCQRGPGALCAFRDMTAFDAYLNIPGVIPACVANRQGGLPAKAEEGENLLVCGLSGGGGSLAISTTSIRHTYRSDFDGASAAAPMVSGVIALLLSQRPDLSWRDVRLILAASARENDPNDSSWQYTALPRPEPVAGMKRFSRKYGFGVADAAAAVAQARRWTSVGHSASLQSCTLTSDSLATSLPDATAPGSPTFKSNTLTALPSSCHFDLIEMVEVTFTADHQYSGDLRVRLTSPNGFVSELADERLCLNSRRDADDCRPYQGWRFIANRHINEAPWGAWTLQVGDAMPGKTGRWLSWSLKLSGRTAPSQ